MRFEISEHANRIEIVSDVSRQHVGAIALTGEIADHVKQHSLGLRIGAVNPVQPPDDAFENLPRLDQRERGVFTTDGNRLAQLDAFGRHCLSALKLVLKPRESCLHAMQKSLRRVAS